MAEDIFYRDVNLSGNQLKNVSGERLSSDPTGVDLYEGRRWYNTTEKKFKYYDGTDVQVQATVTQITATYAKCEEIALASLPANTATAVPTSFTNVFSIQVYTSANVNITHTVTLSGSVAAPMVESTSALTNVKFRIVGR